MSEVELVALIAAILTAGQAASPEPERLAPDEAVDQANALISEAHRK
jgi:hypothetical protein